LVKPEDAKEILMAFGMPAEQQNPNAVYTLLAFADVGPRTAWSRASNPRRTPHDVIVFARDSYQKVYAENTRETIRRQAIHQFVQGGILARNPDDPNLATASFRGNPDLPVRRAGRALSRADLCVQDPGI
jgi:hypothetical protein